MAENVSEETVVDQITDEALVSEVISDETVISEVVDDGSIKIVSTNYTGVDTDNISVTVDNQNFTISAEILQVQYDSILEFPNIGSVKLLYVDTSENAVYRWDVDSLTYVCVGRDYTEIETINGGNAS